MSSSELKHFIIKALNSKGESDSWIFFSKGFLKGFYDCVNFLFRIRIKLKA